MSKILYNGVEASTFLEPSEGFVYQYWDTNSNQFVYLNEDGVKELSQKSEEEGK